VDILDGILDQKRGVKEVEEVKKVGEVKEEGLR
jgi:hypothetical protein